MDEGLREGPEQVAQIGGGRGLAQQRLHAKDLLHRPQGGAMGVGDGVVVAAANECAGSAT